MGQPLPGVTAKQALKAVDKAIELGSKMGPKELKLGAQAHHKAITSMDASGVTSLEDFTAVNAALGRMIASAPKARVMETYNAFAGIVKPEVPSKLMSGVNPTDAAKAYPFLKEIQWKSNLYVQPLPGVTSKQVLKAVDKAIELGS